MSKLNRRSFVQKSALATAGAFTLPRFSIGQAGQSANSKINVAMIAAGNVASQSYQGTKGESAERDVEKVPPRRRSGGLKPISSRPRSAGIKKLVKTPTPTDGETIRKSVDPLERKTGRPKPHRKAILLLYQPGFGYRTCFAGLPRTNALSRPGQFHHP